MDWLAPIPPSAQPQRYAASSFVAPTNFIFQQWDDPTPVWTAPKSESIEIIECEPKRRLRNTVTAPPFVGCGREHNPTYILSAFRSHAVEKPWSKKCGTERGADSGQYFICLYCAKMYGYLW